MPRGLDTYYGRRVTRMETDSDGNWFVELEGEVRVINNDGRRKMPELENGGEGMIFTNMIMDSTSTQMVLRDGTGSEWRVTFNPLKYQIHDPDESQTAWSPQEGGYGVDVRRMLETPPEPTERLADGPYEGDEDEDN